MSKINQHSAFLFQNENNGLIVRSQLRHRLYVVHQLPDSQLHPRLHNRLIDIAAHLARANVSDAPPTGLFKEGEAEKPLLRFALTKKTNGDKKFLQEEFGRVVDSMRAAYLADLIVR